jgi:proline iminopeptidase
MGHSWGGLLALQYSIAYPDHTNLIILSNSAGADSNWFGPFFTRIEERRSAEVREQLAEIEMSQGFEQAIPEVMAEYFRLFFGSYFHDPSLAGQLQAMNHPVTARNALSVFGAMAGFMSDYDISGEIADIVAPTLILHGD